MGPRKSPSRTGSDPVAPDPRPKPPAGRWARSLVRFFQITFWELIDEVLNAVLFVLLGLEVLALKFTASYLLVGLILIPIVLFARLVSVTVPVWLLRARTPVERYTTRLLCWGGLRGGLQVITGGLSPNDQVIIDGVVHAFPGAPVVPHPGTIRFDDAADRQD